MPKRNALIWKVNGAQHHSFLMGTMHVKDKKAFQVFDQAINLMDEVEHYLSEVDLDVLMNSGLPFHLIPDFSLKRELGRSYARIHRIIQKAFELDIAHFDQVKPFVLMNTISELILQEDHRESLDVALWNAAQTKGLKTGGIESLEENLNTMKSLDLEDQLISLKRLSRNVDKFRKRIIHLSDLYVDQRIHELYQMSKKDLGQSKTTLLYERNERMAHRFVHKHESESIFLAIGAAHLSGEKGVLHLLRKSGLRIKPLI